MARIDDLLPTNTIVGCVKIDVEGHELQALRGMEQTLKRSPDVAIVFEYFTGMQEGGASEMRLIKYLESIGFKTWRIDQNGFLQNISAEQLAHGGDFYLLASRKKPNDREIVLPSSVFQFAAVEKNDTETCLMSGPYMTLSRGRYDVIIEGEINGRILFKATHEIGNTIASRLLGHGENSFQMFIPEDCRDFEIVAQARSSNSSLRVERVRLVDKS